MAQRGGPVIDLYLPPTPQAAQVAIMVAECGLDCALQPPDTAHTSDLDPPLPDLVRHCSVPALVDHETGLHVFDAGAILQYLAEKTGRFLPVDPDGKYAVLQWVSWQSSANGCGRDRFEILDGVLQRHDHLAGHYSIADMAWFAPLATDPDPVDLKPFPALTAWYERLRHRPAVRRALASAVQAHP